MSPVRHRIGRRTAEVVHREIVLLGALMVLTAAMFVLTRVAAADHEATRRQEASAWFQAARGGVGSETAIEALRRAVAKDHRNRDYRLALAQALIVGDHDDEARRTLAALSTAWMHRCCARGPSRGLG